MGAGHVNCQNNEYIIDKIESKGFEYDLIASENLLNTVVYKSALIQENDKFVGKDQRSSTLFK